MCRLSGMHIGVVVPAYNAAEWIGDAIASVLVQTHRDWSLVVVDDGSTDGTLAAVASFNDARIRLVRQPNAGVSVARNRGVAELYGAPSPQPPPARGGGVLFLDADDWLAPDALARLNAALDAAPDAVAASGPCTFADTGPVRRPPDGDILQRLLLRQPFRQLRAAADARGGGGCWWWLRARYRLWRGLGILHSYCAARFVRFGARQ